MALKVKMRDSHSVADMLRAIQVGRTFFALLPDHSDRAGIVYELPSGRVLPSVQTTLNACTAGRNDYAVVVADHDHDAATHYSEAVTMSKDSVHLVGLNKPRLVSTGDVITVSGDNVEVAGMWLDVATTKTGIIVDAADHFDFNNNLIVCADAGAATYGFEIGNTTAANYGFIRDNRILEGVNSIFLEITNHTLIQGNHIYTSNASTVGINETSTTSNALGIRIIGNFILVHVTTSTGIALANDTAYSHIVSKNIIVGAATSITQDKWNEGVASDNVIYTGTGSLGVADPAA